MKQYLSFLFLLLTIISCKKEKIKPSWDSNLIIPLANTTISIQEILNDTLYKVENDSSITLIYEKDLFTLQLDSITKIKDTSFSYVLSLNNVSLNPYQLSYSISMGAVARKDYEENGPNGTLYTTIMTAHNTGTPTTIASFGPYTFDSLDLNAGQYFKYLYIKQAVIEVTIKNRLTIPLTDIAFNLKKVSTQEILLNDYIPIVNPMSDETRSATLQNVTLDSLLQAFVTISSPGSNIPVVIDTNQYAQAIVTIKNLQIDSALARFPAQNLLTYHNSLTFNLPDSMMISEVWLDEGSLQLNFYNTLKNKLFIDFQLPDARKNGIPFQIQLTIPESDGITPSSVQQTIDLSNYKINFRGLHSFELQQGDLNQNNHIDADTTNALYYVVSAKIDSTGEFIKLTKFDSIQVFCVFNNIKTSYVKGFFGYKNILLDSAITYQFLSNNISFNDFELQQAKLNLIISNQIGTNANATIEHLTAYNTQKNTQKTLSGTVLSTPINISKPIDPNSLNVSVTPTITNYSITSQNSNIHELISLVPDKIDYQFRIALNPFIPLPQPTNANDFIYKNTKLSLKLNAEVPLSFKIEELELKDTISTDFSKIDVDDVIDGKINLISTNYFPLSFNVKIYLLDNQKQTYDSLHVVPIQISPGLINPIYNKVTNPTKNKNIIPLSHYKLLNFIKAKYILIKAKVNSQPQNMHVSIYNSYFIHFNLTGDFNYKFEQK